MVRLRSPLALSKVEAPIVAVIMGSRSDLQTMQEGINILKKFGMGYEVKILSAHRTPQETVKYSLNAQKKGIEVIIAGAGGAAALPGVIAAHTVLPVIGVPIETKSLQGMDSLLSIVQMPSGVPVASMAIGKAGARNAAILALQILALKDRNLKSKLISYKKKLNREVIEINKKLCPGK